MPTRLFCDQFDDIVVVVVVVVVIVAANAWCGDILLLFVLSRWCAMSLSTTYVVKLFQFESQQQKQFRVSKSETKP